jgi:prephenate dehydratase
VNDGETDCGIVPIENSIDGSINITLDALAYEVDLYITDEYVLKINQNLLVKKGTKKEDIRSIASHSSALGQCGKFLHDEFPSAKLTAMNSTVQAVLAARDSDGSIAAIGSAGSADVYGMDIMYPECNDTDNNRTRFVVISKTRSIGVSDHDKSSVVFTLPHESGSLYRALGMFERAGINMLKIESRPLKTELGKYIFFIDIEGNADNPEIYFALDNIRAHTSFYKFLGSYRMDTK